MPYKVIEACCMPHNHNIVKKCTCCSHRR